MSLAAEMEAWEAAGLRRRMRRVEGPVGPRARIDGKDVLVMCSNAYLALHLHPDVKRAAGDAVATYGTGSTGSRLISGNLDVHVALEEAIARLKGTEDAVVFGTGYQANVGTVGALVGKGDLVLSDALNHASLIDACRLSRATVKVYSHGDAQEAARLLQEAPRHRRTLLLTDGVFSMDGDIAPLAELADACEDADAMLMVDDAHGTGVLGPRGDGTAAHLGVADRVGVHMGTLSKAVGSEGGFVAGSRELCEHLRNRARSFVFSTAPAPASMAAATAALRIIAADARRRARLGKRAATLRAGLREAGRRVPDGITPIVPVHVGPSDATMAMAQALWDRGVFASGIRPPTVPDGTGRIRATVMSEHSAADVAAAVAAFREAA